MEKGKKSARDEAAKQSFPVKIHVQALLEFLTQRDHPNADYFNSLPPLLAPLDGEDIIASPFGAQQQ